MRGLKLICALALAIAPPVNVSAEALKNCPGPGLTIQQALQSIEFPTALVAKVHKVNISLFASYNCYDVHFIGEDYIVLSISRQIDDDIYETVDFTVYEFPDKSTRDKEMKLKENRSDSAGNPDWDEFFFFDPLTTRGFKISRTAASNYID